MRYLTLSMIAPQTSHHLFPKALILPGVMAMSILVFPPWASAVDPPPDGGYANENTAEGEDALFSLTTGEDNTALGFEALYHNTSGVGNTAVGSLALFANTTGLGNTASGDQALRD